MILVLKLSNGDTVMGLLSVEDDDVFMLQDPFHVEYRVDIKGYRSMVLHRSNPFSEEMTVPYYKHHVISHYVADLDLCDYYFYTLDHSIKFRDKAMSQDIQRACEYIQHLIDNNNNPDVKEQQEEPTEGTLTVMPVSTSNTTIH